MFRKIAIALATVAALTGAAHADGMSCISRMVVNISENQAAYAKTEPKVMAKIKNELKAVLASVNDADRDSKIKAFMDNVSVATAEVLKHDSNSDIDGAVALAYNSTVNTIAFIEQNAKNPASPNILASKKGQVTAAITQVIYYHLSCGK